MKTKVIFKSENNNYYLQDLNNNLLIYLPKELKDCFDRKGDTTEINSYYHKKYQFLVRNHNNSQVIENSYSGRLSPEFVRRQFINSNQITFEVTEKCNLDCKYCGCGDMYADHDPRENKNLNWNYAKKLIDHLSQLWKTNENLSTNKIISIGFYGGEPLLNMKFIKKTVNYLYEKSPKHVRFTFTMTTNGVLLHKHLDFLKSHNFNISISLDGNENNNCYRIDKIGNNSFKKVFINAKMVESKYPRYFDSNINFFAVLHDKNSVEDIIKFFKSEFNKVPKILGINTSGIRKDKIEEFNKLYKNVSESIATSEDSGAIKQDLMLANPHNRTLQFYLNTFSGNVVKDYIGFFKDNLQRKWTPTGTCSPFSKKIFIKADGKILPCERIGHQFSIGDINSDTVNINFEKIANTYNKHFEKLKKQCTSCYRLKGCIMCIFNIENLENKPSCHGHLNATKFKVFLTKNLSLLEKNNHLYKRIMKEVIIM